MDRAWLTTVQKSHKRLRHDLATKNKKTKLLKDHVFKQNNVLVRNACDMLNRV